MKTRLLGLLATLNAAWRKSSLLWALALLVAVLLIAVALAPPNFRAWRTEAQRLSLTGAPGTGPQLPGTISGSRQAGLLSLDDFQITVPPGWQRRKDWEDQGPGTKLFLLGPKIAGGQLVIGIDVYALHTGTTLEDFVRQYSSKWNQALLTDKPATLCEKPARLLAITENGLDKVYLVSLWRDKGFAVGMIAPAGQMTAATSTFRLVVDTFQLYE